MSTVEDEAVKHAPSCHGGLANLDDEYSYWIEDVDGVVPADLRGTFLRNGPGRQRIGTETYGHWFDGDGMLSVFSFVDGRVHFKNRYVRTPKYIEETAAQRILYRGFGTHLRGGMRANIGRQPANPANTNVIYHGAKLLALWEGGRPWELDPATLQTIGECNYRGQLTKANVFSAHGKVHSRTGDLFNFGAGLGGIGRKGVEACINIYRINSASRMRAKGRVPLDTFPFAHDFALSDRYAIFFINSIVSTAMGSVILGRTSISDQMKFDDDVAMQILVVDLDTFEVVRRFETDPGAIIHFGNAYEEGDTLVVDGMYASDFDANETLSDVFNSTKFGGGTYRRYRLDLGTGAMSTSQMSDTESEFPTFNTRYAGFRNDVTYTITSVDNGADSFYNGFQRVTDDDVSEVTLEPGWFASEPMFAPAVGASREDDGYVLDVVYNAHDHISELHIHRGDDLTNRVAVLELRHHLPHQFHGHWQDRLLLNEASAA